jgi:hypothetical protein
MSDDNVIESNDTTIDADVTVEVEQSEPQGTQSDTDWKREARKWESRAKADQDAAAKWREFELSQKSDFEKLTEELTRAKTEAESASTKLTRFEVAAHKGIPAEALDLLVGSTREELEANADKLLSLIQNQSKNKSVPDANQGQPAPSNVGQVDAETLKTMTPSEIMSARAEGRLDELLGRR